MKLLTTGFTLTALALTIGACSSGGSSSPAPSNTPFTASVSGTAAKGIINKGIVTAVEIDSAGVALSTVGSAVTGIDGSYALTLGASYSGGPVQVTITIDANSEMKCDVPVGCGTRSDGIADSNTSIDFGEWYKPGSLSMKAIIPVASTGDVISANITPFTNMASDRAIAQGSVTAASVATANSEVSNLLGGIDILHTQPLDITDPTAVSDGTATAVTYAALASSVASLSPDPAAGEQVDISAALATLSNSFTDGMIEADDAGDASDDASISLQEIVDGANNVFTVINHVDNTGTITELQSDITTAESGSGVIDPVASVTAADATLDQVKAMVADVFTWGSVIMAETEVKGNAFQTQIDLATQATDIATQEIMDQAFQSAVEAAIDYDGSTSVLSEIVLTDPAVSFSSGSISTTNGVVTIIDAVMGDATVNLSIQFPEDGVTYSTTMTLGILSASIMHSSGRAATINSGNLVVTLLTPYTVDYSALDLGTAVDPEVNTMTLSIDVSLTEGTSAVNPVTFSGNVGATLYASYDSTGIIDWVTPATLSLGGAVANATGDSLDFSITANVSNAATFDPVGDYNCGTQVCTSPDMVSWSYSDSNGDSVDDTFVYSTPNVTETIVFNGNDTVTRTNSYYYGYSDTNTYSAYSATSISQYVTSYTYYNYGVYAYIDGQGDYYADTSLEDFSIDGSADGVLQYPEFVIESATNFMQATLGLNFTAQLTGLPEASISVTGTRDEFEGGYGVITIAYGTRQIEMAFDASGPTTTAPDGTATGTLTITNQDGIVMTIALDNSQASNDLTFNGTVYATIVEMDNGLTKISYIDGTFEIF